MEILLVAVIAICNIACFVIGARVGQKVQRGEEIRLPETTPIAAIRPRRESREDKMERERLDAILRNIDRYDGSTARQEDVPGR